TQDVLYKVSCAPIHENLTLLCFEDQSDREHVSQMRRDFVANVSHELKTPLTALLGFIETLNTSARADASARERFLKIMEREAQRMNRLVSDLLSLSQVEAVERMRPNEVVDVSRLLQETATTLAPVAEARGVRLHVVNADRLVKMAGDKDQLRQVFINLIENAIKYGGPNNEVSVTLSDIRYQTRLRCEGIAISVADKGPGIDALNIPRLTERFYRIDSHRSREMGGTGLGLAIVKHIVSRHRGVLKIDSAVGKGSEFKIILPI
ncbi:MAG: ATP-binding protein, partial [Rhodobacteraceae bacterium]|nr:ATP-binding protein [Paracoccaceae bacterium]